MLLFVVWAAHMLEKDAGETNLQHIYFLTSKFATQVGPSEQMRKHTDSADLACPPLSLLSQGVTEDSHTNNEATTR